jgi:hypothetical protein
MKCDGCAKNKDCNPYYNLGETYFYCESCADILKVNLWTENV